MATRYVVDTNVLVHALDRREPEKRERAREVLRRVGGARTAALPAQVLSEFGGACLRKLEPRPDAEAIQRESSASCSPSHSCRLPAPWYSRPCGASGSTCSPTTTPRSGRSPA